MRLTCIRSRTSAVLYGVIRGTTTGALNAVSRRGCPIVLPDLPDRPCCLARCVPEPSQCRACIHCSRSAPAAHISSSKFRMGYLCGMHMCGEGGRRLAVFLGTTSCVRGSLDPRVMHSSVSEGTPPATSAAKWAFKSDGSQVDVNRVALHARLVGTGVGPFWYGR